MFKLASLLISRILGRLSIAFAKNVDVGSQVKFYGAPIITTFCGGSIKIGDRVVLVSDPRFTDLGVSKPVILRTLHEKASITIGNDTGCSGVTICAAKSVEIGESCLIGADVIIADTDFHQIEPIGRRYGFNSNKIKSSAVVIGSNVFIGARSIILKGVKIGDNSVIGAGSLVARSIPANVVASGVPAVVLRKI